MGSLRLGRPRHVINKIRPSGKPAAKQRESKLLRVCFRLERHNHCEWDDF